MSADALEQVLGLSLGTTDDDYCPRQGRLHSAARSAPATEREGWPVGAGAGGRDGQRCRALCPCLWPLSLGLALPASSRGLRGVAVFSVKHPSL